MFSQHRIQSGIQMHQAAIIRLLVLIIELGLDAEWID
jgi:hypothetical protein